MLNVFEKLAAYCKGVGTLGDEGASLNRKGRVGPGRIRLPVSLILLSSFRLKPFSDISYSRLPSNLNNRKPAGL